MVPAMPTPNRDPEHLAHLRDYYADAKRIPSERRIGDLLGFSNAAAHKLLTRLAALGFLERTPDDDAWIPGNRFFERFLSESSVPAGTPMHTTEVAGEPFYVDDYLIRRPSQTTLVPVRGDSMIDCGIHDGDIAVVDRGLAAKSGDHVVAIIDNEFTLKELATERGGFILKPHNKSFAVIRPKGSLEIYGVVVGIIRRYGR
jgi:repressor LexA